MVNFFQFSMELITMINATVRRKMLCQKIDTKKRDQIKSHFYISIHIRIQFSNVEPLNKRITHPFRSSSVDRRPRLFLYNPRQSTHHHAIVQSVEEVVSRYNFRVWNVEERRGKKTIVSLSPLSTRMQIFVVLLVALETRSRGTTY